MVFNELLSPPRCFGTSDSAGFLPLRANVTVWDESEVTIRAKSVDVDWLERARKRTHDGWVTNEEDLTLNIQSNRNVMRRRRLALAVLRLRLDSALRLYEEFNDCLDLKPLAGPVWPKIHL